MKRTFFSWARRSVPLVIFAWLSGQSAAAEPGAETRAPGIQAQIDGALRAGQTSVRIEPGVYRTHTPKPRSPHLLFRAVTNLTVEAAGVMLICLDSSSAIWFERCRNVTVRGLAIDYDPLPLTQGTIVGFAPDRSWTDVRIHDGYPEPRLNRPGQAFYWVYDRDTRLIKLGSANRFVQSIEPLGGGVFRLDHGKHQINDTAAVGDLIRMPQKWEVAHGITQRDCETVTLEDIVLYTCPGFGIAEQGGSGNVYRRVRIVPGPPPPGATEPRLFSSMFDGINLAFNRVGPTVENCELVLTGDDGIAVYSPNARVIQPPSGCVLTVSPAEEANTFRPGDRVRLYRFADTNALDAKIVAVERASLKPAEIREAVTSSVPDAASYQFRSAWRLTLDAAVAASAGDVCANESQAGRGFRIESNTVFNGGSRGIVVNQSGGVVRGNRIEHTFLPGIHMFEFMRETGSAYQSDVEISGNRIGWSCRGLSSRDGWCGAICVTGWDKAFQIANGHRRLVIASNEIHSAVGVNLQIHCATGVDVRGNRFLETHPVKIPQGQPRPVDNRAVVYLEKAGDIRFEDNTVLNPGPFAAPDGLLVKGPGTGSVTGGISRLQAEPEAAAQLRAGQKLLADLKAAVASGAKAFLVPPATYRLSANLELRGLEGFVLNGQGATLIFAPGGGKVLLQGCRDCAVKGLTLDLDPLPFTQGTVLSVDPVAKTADIRLDAGYPGGNEKGLKGNPRCVFFDPAGERELEIIDTWTPPPVEVAPGVHRIRPPRIFDVEARKLAAGDRVALSLPGGGGGFYLRDCANIRVEDVTVYAAGNFAFTEDGLAEGGHTYERCRVVRRPGSGRLMAGAADGLHSITQRKGPTLRNCEISHCFDDLVNIHNFFSFALERTERGTWLIAGPGGQDFSEGSLLRFYRAPNAEPLGEARVVSCPRSSALTAEEVGTRVAEHFQKSCHGLRLRSFFKAQVCEVTLDRQVPLEPYDFVSCPDFGGAGAVIEDCHFHDGHVRGILLKSSGSVVARCRFERLARSGLVVAPEIYWLEGPFPRDVRIIGNTFADCGFGAVSTREKYGEFAPLMVMSAFADRLFPPLFSGAVNMERIECVSNRIIRAPGPGILLMNAAEVKLIGNSITAPGAKPDAAGLLDLTRNLPPAAKPAEAELDAMRQPAFGIFLMSVRGVRGEGNRVEGGRGLVGKGWGAEDVDVR